MKSGLKWIAMLICLSAFLSCSLTGTSVDQGNYNDKNKLVPEAAIVSATASTVYGANSANLSCDGNTGTRWESSQGSDPQWIYWDLGSSQNLTSITIDWEAAAASNYQIQGSANASTWTTLATVVNSTYMLDHVKITTAISGSYRYVRMYGTKRTTAYGYSIWEVSIGTSGGNSSSTGSGSVITLKAMANNLFVCAGNAGTSPLIANRATASTWEQFQQINNSDGTISLKAMANNLYVTASASPLIANSATIGAGQKFQRVDNGDGTISLKAVVNGLFVCADTAGTSPLIANRATASTWEKFQVNAGNSSSVPSTTSSSGAYSSYAASSVGAFWGDTTTIPAATKVMTFKFINRTYGAYPDNQVYWSFQNGTINEVHTIAEKSTYDMPANSSGRMYFGLGVAPNAANPNSYWDFIEFTIGPAQFNGNTTRVDAFGLKIAMRMHCKDGYDIAVGENEATFKETRAATIQRFKNSVPAEFQGCATKYEPYRIVEPGGIGFNAGGQYAAYYDSYVNQIWANNGITIAKPGPNGDGLGAYPDLSAAIYRHVGAAAGTFNANGTLKNQSLWANSAAFYTAAPANYYAKFWHDCAIDGKSYGFPYDDVGGYSSYISHNDPQWMVIAIGY